MKINLLVAALLFGAATSAQAQIIQSGTATAGHALIWATSGVAQDAGTATAPATSNPLNTLGIVNTGTPFCISDAAITGQYHQLCLGSNSLGGGLLSYNAYGGASSLPMQVNINGTTTTIGTGTINTGTSGNLPVYSGSTALSADANINASNQTLTIGVAGSTTGLLKLTGSGSGTVTIQGQAAAGTFNFNLPVTAGTAGQALLSGGGGSSPMTWASFAGTVDSGTANQAAYYVGTGTEVGGTSSITLTSTTATISPSGASTMDNVAIGNATRASGKFTTLDANGNVTLSPTGTVGISPSGLLTLSPATLSTMDNVTIGATTKAAGSFTTVLATGQISSGVAGASLGSLALSGNSSGTVLVKVQAASGSYNWNLPITAGSSGQPVLSGGGGASPMTYGSLAGNTTTFATTTGVLTSGHVATFDANGNINDGGALPTGTINSGTAGQFTYYAGSGTTVSGNANLTISGGAVTVGVAGATAGSVLLTGSSTGTITVKGSSATIGTYNFNLPTTAGTSGQPMLSGGGVASAMTWGTVTGNTTLFPTFSGSTTNGNCVAMNASGNLIDNGSPCGTGGSGTVTSSTAGQVAYYASSTNAVAGNSSLTISGGAVTIGVTGTTAGSLLLSGSSTGTITIKGSGTTIGTYNFNLPTTVGSAGQVLTSQGGGATAMTWTTPGTSWGSGQTVNFNAAVNTAYCIDTTGGAVTATMPAGPADGDQIQFTDCTNQFATNKFTVSRNGKNIMALASDMDVTSNSASFTLRYWSTNGDWRLQ